VSAAKNRGIAAFVTLLLFIGAGSISAASDAYFPFLNTEVALRIMQRYAQEGAPSKKTILGEQLHSATLVENFYRERVYQPAWSLGGRLTQADMLIKALDDAYADGLSPAYYHRARIISLMDAAGKESYPDTNRLADLDILLTDAFLTLACHLSAGCANPLPAASQWYAKTANVDVSSLLDKALRENQVLETLTNLRPEKGIYTRLKRALEQYRELVSIGEWPQLEPGPALRKGARSHRVAELRKRLAASGDLIVNETAAGDTFDDTLEQSVIAFQKRHGLNGDGVVSRETLVALNVPLKQRLRQIELNMERLRWILGNQEERYIIVNIAAFNMSVIEKGNTVLSMKVVVGKPYQSTPVFTAKMTHIVINPSWNIPKSIVQKEILRLIAKKPNYLASQNIEVLEKTGDRAWTIATDTTSLTGNASKYRFRQKPGAKNALGQLKFMLPNSHDVYLHDTPSKSLFARNVRAFSHGCIRIENPIGLAEYLLRDNPYWTRSAIVAAIGKGVERTVHIPQPLDVHLLYLTAWVDEDGSLQFRNDIYGRDRILDEALRKRPYIE
jgi:L,D-transpeptidase YcbB